MLAFHNNPSIKAAKLAQIRAHGAADEIIKGHYWENGKGCAVGCTVHSGDHYTYERDMGIPVMLARLEDQIFEGMPHAEAKLFPARFIEAIPVGADLSLVGWKFLHWLIVDVTERRGTEAPVDAIEVLRKKSCGEPVSVVEVNRARIKVHPVAYANKAAYAAFYDLAGALRIAAYEAARASGATAAARETAFNRQAEKLLELLAAA